MINQFQAGYYLDSVKQSLYSFAQNSNKEMEVQGLLRNLSTFDIETNINLEPPNQVPSIFAVAINIVTRGKPTLPSVFLEEWFSAALSLTSRKDSDLGAISFPFRVDHDKNVVDEELFQAMHSVDPRLSSGSDLYLDNLDSNFERDFLTTLIPSDKFYLSHLLEKQRTRESLNHANARGTVDFCLEIPYLASRSQTNRYAQNVNLNGQRVFVIEVDGAKYHNGFVDDQKDFAVAQLRGGIKHITETNLSGDLDVLLEAMNSEDFVQRIKRNFGNPDYVSSPKTAVSLAPFGIARLQLVYLKYLIANYETLVNAEKIKVAVVEKDLPCAWAAFEDLDRLLVCLNELTEHRIKIPGVELTVYCENEFFEHQLHNNFKVSMLSELDSNNYDLVLDISLLRRSGVFKEDVATPNTIRIRNSHHTSVNIDKSLLSARSIKYKPLVNALDNDQYDVIEDNVFFLEKILHDVFRKKQFREGQLPILHRALRLEPVIGLLPTGGGKSLTYQLAGILQPGTTIIVDPIRSLMVDQYNGLIEIGIDRSEFVNSTLSTAERLYVLDEMLIGGQVQFLFVSPERFVIQEFRDALAQSALEGHFFSYVVIDEVHCVSEWGHDFRIPYLNVGDNAQEFCKTLSGATIPLLGLTATASFDVLADIERELKISENDGNAVVRHENSVRDEINYQVHETPADYSGLDRLTRSSIRTRIGQAKQAAVFDYLENLVQKISPFNEEGAIRKGIEKSIDEFLPVTLKQELQNDNTQEHYVSGKIKSLLLGHSHFGFQESDRLKMFNYGMVVFVPHRNGPFGVRNGGLYDNHNFVHSITLNERECRGYNDDVFGYFMGSADQSGVAADKIMRDSFRHLGEFKNNHESVMIATKAFGMGIDKPNIRMTAHLNMPQSIESFVQEAGRGGRDGKNALAVIMYNRDHLGIEKGEKPDFHLDKEILLFFHNNSFKGEFKENQMLEEILDRIAFPNISNIELIARGLNKEYSLPGESYSLAIYQDRRIYINNLRGESVGHIGLDTWQSETPTPKAKDVIEWLLRQIPVDRLSFREDAVKWLRKGVRDTESAEGVLSRLERMQFGESEKFSIPFKNSYFSVTSNQGFTLSNDHLSLVRSSSIILEKVESGELESNKLSSVLSKSVKANLEFEEFVDQLDLQIDDYHDRQGELSSLKNAYHSPRGEDDTAKAIYRLLSLGVLSEYTIDYQNKFYNVVISKQSIRGYFRNLEQLVSRYSSKNMAKTQIETLWKKHVEQIKAEDVRVLRNLLSFWTGFVYDKIKKKRLEAIDHMVDLCELAITYDDPIKQNLIIKEDIYYYFNAKYSKRDHEENIPDDDGINNRVSASMIVDFEQGKGVEETIFKYIHLVENPATGEFVSNLKHLRGSTQRMLRTNPESVHFRILKSYSLFVMADSIPGLLIEANRELSKGIEEWYTHDFNSCTSDFLERFRVKIENHVTNEIILSQLDEVLDLQMVDYQTLWLQNFNKQITTNYS